MSLKELYNCKVCAKDIIVTELIVGRHSKRRKVSKDGAFMFQTWFCNECWDKCVSFVR